MGQNENEASSPSPLSKDDTGNEAIPMKAEPPTEPPPANVEYSVFTPGNRRIIVGLCALAGFLSPFTAFTYFPALEYMADDLEVSLQLMDLTITMFLVIQGIIPAVLGDAADQIGRRPVYIFVLAVYCAASVLLTVQTSYPALMAGRMLQSAGSSGTIALGVMTIADLAPPHTRGQYLGAMLSGPNCGPSIGPVLGGLIAEMAGWRWIFCMLAVLGGASLIPIVLIFPETCRFSVGNGAYTAGKRNKEPLPLLSPKNRQAPPKELNLRHGFRNIPNPFKCLRLLLNRHDALLLSSNATFYLAYSCLHASLAPQIMKHYNLNALEGGLCYLSYGVATISSSYLVGKVLNWDYRVTAKKEGIVINTVEGDKLEAFPVEKARLRSIWYYVFGGILATIGFGWSIETEVHLSSCLVMATVCGVCYTGVFNSLATLNVDLHPNETGLASVAVSVTRCLAAAAGVGVMQPLLNSAGVGWTFTLFALICSLSIPMLYLLRVRGANWRDCKYGPEAA